jgi:hypothetical protein
MAMQKRIELGAAGFLDLGSASDETVAGWAVQIVDGGSMAGLSLLPQRKLTGGESSGFVNTAYKDMADETVKTAALTAASQIYVISDGYDIRINVSAISGGSVIIEATARLG